MGLGVLEDRALEHVPGTTRYFDDPERPQYASDGQTHLKCDTSGPVPIILVPQPSDDPNDPLNWPLWKRDLITFVISLTAIFATALGPILASNTVTLSFYLEQPLSKVAELTGYFLLGCGIGAIFFVPSARLFGKRHAFVIGIAILIASSAWNGAAGTNYHSWVGARIVQGIGCAPYESLVNAAVGDLYFVHQRGYRMAFTNLAVFGGAFFTPIVVGKITITIDWWWSFYLVAIFCAVCLPVIVFFVPEMAYQRDAKLNIDLLATSTQGALGVPDAAAAIAVAAATKPARQSDSADLGADAEKNASEAGTTAATIAPPTEPHLSSNGSASGNSMENTANTTPEARTPLAAIAAGPLVPRKKTWLQSIALFDGFKTDENFIKLLLRPFPLFLQPAFLWAALIQGALIGWTVFIGVILGEFTFSYPLWWQEDKIGYAYTGAFVGALVGFAIAGLLADFSARLLTRLNGGVYEPEFRLVLIVPQLVLGCAGLYGWGITADGLLKDKYPVQVPLTFFGLVVAAMVIGAVASSLYIVDAYRDLAIEGFTCLIIFKNFFSFALTFKAFQWLVDEDTHATPLFKAVGTVQLIICLLSIPMYIFGKRVRSFFYRHDLLAMFGVR